MSCEVPHKLRRTCTACGRPGYDAAIERRLRDLVARYPEQGITAKVAAKDLGEPLERVLHHVDRLRVVKIGAGHRLYPRVRS